MTGHVHGMERTEVGGSRVMTGGSVHVFRTAWVTAYQETVMKLLHEQCPW